MNPPADELDALLDELIGAERDALPIGPAGAMLSPEDCDYNDVCALSDWEPEHALKSTWSCLDPSHASSCTVCIEPPPIGMEATYMLSRERGADINIFCEPVALYSFGHCYRFVQRISAYQEKILHGSSYQQFPPTSFK